MYIFFEQYAYDATQKAVRDGLAGIVPEWQNIDCKIAVDYVGYYFEPALHDCVFILPKVLLRDEGCHSVLVIDKNHTINPEDIITPQGQKQALAAYDDFRHFLYNFAIWIYRTLSVYRDKNPGSRAIYSHSLPQTGVGQKQKVNTYLDVILSLIRFDIENQDFFLYIVRNQHSGLNKINWTRTISKSHAFLQKDSPLYLNPINKKRKINFDEELFILFFSILDYCNSEYGFRAPICIHYPLLSHRQIEYYRQSGQGVNRLQRIRYKYFSDKAIRLWDLCYTFFNLSHELYTNTHNREFLLARKYNVIFESMIDTLVGEPHENIPLGLKEQDDGKIVDHIYTNPALSSPEDDLREVYYIGDSKYYSIGHPLTAQSLAKQYTYARNVIQWNIDFWNANAQCRNSEKGDARFRRVRLRQDINQACSVEGYDIIPNFFISAFVNPNHIYDDKQDNFRLHDGEQGSVHISTQFPDRLFDRDTLILSHYDVNFLYVVMLYARNRTYEQAVWKDKIRRHFRQQVQKVLEDRYSFYAMKPKNVSDGTEYIQTHFKQLIGKLYQPEEYIDRHLYILALEKPQPSSGVSPLSNQQTSLLDQLKEHFEIALCQTKDASGNSITKMDVIPDSIRDFQPSLYSSNDWLLFVVAEGTHFDKMIDRIKETGKIGVALQMGGAVLRLKEGLHQARYLVVHNKSDKQHIFMFEKPEPILVPGSEQDSMAVTKRDAELYLVYQVRTNTKVYLGNLNLDVVTRSPKDSYAPQFHRLSEVIAP